MLSKGAFENWYFEYCEAEREFLDARRSFELKRRDISLFLFSAHTDWCGNRFGEVLRPKRTAVRGDLEQAVDLFFAEFKVTSCFRDTLTRLLNEAFDERFGELSKRRSSFAVILVRMCHE